ACGRAASGVVGALLPMIGSLDLLLVGTVAIVAALALFWAPASALVSDEAEAIGLDQGLAAALMNLAWAGGQVIGGGLGGAVADAARDGAPHALLRAAPPLRLRPAVPPAPPPPPPPARG